MTTFGSALVPTATLVGTHAIPVQVEIDISAGLPSFIVVGLGDTAVMEARDRIRSAIRASGFSFPSARVVANLAPAPLRKHGTGFDLPIAAAILIATAQIPKINDRMHLVGELSLDGRIRAVSGLLAHALSARSQQHRIGVSDSGADSLKDIPGLNVVPLGCLDDLRRPDEFGSISIGATQDAQRLPMVPDLSEIHGHESAKRVLEITAAGEHDLMFVGPPGSGKTMLAQCLPGLLPSLSLEERLESAVIHDIAGFDPAVTLRGVRPFRAPHHSITSVGLVGGGTPPRPGEISLAHNGVLFLDEFPQFAPGALQSLRQPLEEGSITLVRSEGRIRFPSRFSLVAAANPCPCGFNGDPQHSCSCSPHVISRYSNRIGGPLLDRIDLVLRVNRIEPGLMLTRDSPERSKAILKRVMVARNRVSHRGVGPTRLLSGNALLDVCDMTVDGVELLELQARRHRLSGRGITRLLRVSRTIADLAGQDRVSTESLAEAIGYRGGDVL